MVMRINTTSFNPKQTPIRDVHVTSVPRLTPLLLHWEPPFLWSLNEKDPMGDAPQRYRTDGRSSGQVVRFLLLCLIFGKSVMSLCRKQAYVGRMFLILHKIKERNTLHFALVLWHKTISICPKARGAAMSLSVYHYFHYSQEEA